MTKNKIKEAMLQVIADQDISKDEWYASNRTFAEFGIRLLAEALNIDLGDIKDE